MKRWPRHLTALALIFGMSAGLLTVTTDFSPVSMITFAQALTVSASPRWPPPCSTWAPDPELTGDRRLPRKTLSLAYLGTAVVVILAIRKATSLIAQLFFS